MGGCARGAGRLAALAWLAWVFLAWPALAVEAVHLVLSDDAPAYREAADAFRAAYGARKPVVTWSLDALAGEGARALTRDHLLLVPVGIKAARFIAEHHAGQAAVLSLMVPRASFERIAWPERLARRKLGAVYIDQPVSRPLELIAEVLPGATRLAALVSSDNADALRQLTQEAARRRLAVNGETVAAGGEVGPALRRVLEGADVLLLLPDSVVANVNNVQSVLLASYRARVPVVGYSRGLARAGAVAVAYSSPAQIGRQGARLAERWTPDAGLPPPQHAGEFMLDFNPHVARSLGLALPPARELRGRLGAREEG